MKSFIRTLAGKTVLFVLLVLSLCILAGNVLGILCFLSEELPVYTRNEQELTESIGLRNRMQPRGGNVLLDVLSDTPVLSENTEWRILDADGKLVKESSQYAADARFVSEYTYCVFQPAGIELPVENQPMRKMLEWAYPENHLPVETEYETFTVSLAPKEGTSLWQEIKMLTGFLHLAYSLRYAVYPIAFVILLLVIGLFVTLMYAAGRRAADDEIHPGPLFRVPFDLMLVFCVCGMAFLIYAAGEGIRSDFASILAILALSLVSLNFALGLCMSAAVRIKCRTLLKNTVVWRILRGIWLLVRGIFRFVRKAMRAIPLLWKTLLLYGGITLTEFVLLGLAEGDAEIMSVIWLGGKLLLLPAMLYFGWCLRKLQKSGDALARGNLSYHTETRGLVWDLKTHGENLNRVADSISVAVEARLKSERMETELITNVSHDLKTPLTSVINYADLIAAEPSENPKITEYAEVLVRQSGKLKRLIEDLVEASKASTGNLEVLPAPCDPAVFLTQASGEYAERLQAAGLTLVTKQPEKELKIMADGRRMWRIYDNLMNNICKYAMPGTRVYLTLTEESGLAVTTFRNTSREPLDLTPEELTERFVRGDSSRNTEGNGLGLAIARSMAELQGGTLTVSADGDLFKAVLTFPMI